MSQVLPERKGCRQDEEEIRSVEIGFERALESLYRTRREEKDSAPQAWPACQVTFGRWMCWFELGLWILHCSADTSNDGIASRTANMASEQP
jgi:hypothetical protein